MRARMFAASTQRSVGSKRMSSSSDEYTDIARITLQHYNQRAEAFWAGTRDHDVTQNIAAMSAHSRRASRSRCWIWVVVLAAT